MAVTTTPKNKYSSMINAGFDSEDSSIISISEEKELKKKLEEEMGKQLEEALRKNVNIC